MQVKGAPPDAGFEGAGGAPARQGGISRSWEQSQRVLAPEPPEGTRLGSRPGSAGGCARLLASGTVSEHIRGF